MHDENTPQTEAAPETTDQPPVSVFTPDGQEFHDLDRSQKEAIVDVLTTRGIAHRWQVSGDRELIVLVTDEEGNGITAKPGDWLHVLPNAVAFVDGPPAEAPADEPGPDDDAATEARLLAKVEELEELVEKLKAQTENDGALTASEALCGFVGWLTTRETPAHFSARHNSAIAAELLERYCAAQNLPEPRDGYAELLQSVPEEEPTS